MSPNLKKRILVVEDEPTLRLALQDALEAEGSRVDAVEDGNSGLELFRTHHHEIVLTDLVMPGLDGLQLIERVMAIDPATTVFAFTAHGSVDNAVQAMKLGAADFLAKPFSISELVERIRRREMGSGKGSTEEVRQPVEVDERYRFGQIVGKSEKMRRIYDLIETVAASDANILIQGDSGTGKELVAAAIHYNSPRREQPFIKVSCASLTETLLESELFGHERGSFTGALQRKIGRFEQAQGGTLFLDEIGDVSETVQVKLLRVLQEREFERVGGTDTIHVDVRIVSATLHDIDDLVARGRFREDLFYRINTVTIKLPTLAERMEDVLILAEHFRAMHSERLGKEVTRFTPEALRALQNYSWPGNVREVKNAVERAVLLTRNDRIGVEELPEAIRSVAQKGTAAVLEENGRCNEPIPLDEAMQCAERRHIRMVLNHTGFNRTRASEILGISRKTLWEKMRHYGIEEERGH